MENRIIFRAGIKRHKGSLLGIAALLFLITLSLCTVLTVSIRGNRYIQDELQRIGFGSLTAWVSDVPDMDDLTKSIRSQEGVEGITRQNLIFSEYEGNGVESDSEGQLIPWQTGNQEYRFFRDDLSGYEEAPEVIGEKEVYISPSMVSAMNLQIGDSITFPIARNGKNISFTVAGYYEDPVMGSSMIGMKGFLISPSAFDQIRQILVTEGADTLARSGAMLHITVDGDSGLTVSEMNQRLNENTPLSQYTEFIHSADAIENFMVILQNAFSGLLAAFALILLGVAFVVLGHSISGIIEQDWKDLGILKTIGMTGKQLVHQQVIQYLVAVFAGLLTGIVGAVPAVGIISRMTVTTSGVLVPPGITILPCLGVSIILLLLLTGFAVIKLNKIHLISPMEAIRGEESKSSLREKQDKHRKPRLAILEKGLMFRLAWRQFLSGRRRYFSACIVALLLVFFASLTGRMNNWLGPNGQGMMDAFNPADLDLGIQVLGELSQQEMEQVVQSYSTVTDSYELAMPSVSVNGANYTANVITEPQRFHISRGETSRNTNEVVLTETAASDLGVDIGDMVTIRGDKGTKEFVISGIYHCANDMGANLGMSRDGYLSIGNDDAKIWCHHYFLENPSQKQVITDTLEARYGGDVHIHENTWPGLLGIINAMHILLLFMYGMSAVFICIVTVMTGTRILDAEKKDLGIYKSIGCSVKMLRVTFALRFGIAAAVGAVIGIVGAGYLTDPLVSAVMRLAGISNFTSSPSVGMVLLPGVIITALFIVCSYFVAGKIKKEDMTVLAAE